MGRTRVRWSRVAGLAVSSCLVIGLVGAQAGAGPAASGHPRTERAALRTYVVAAGDTLWGIAVGQVGRRGDPRPFVDRLVALNHLDGAMILPGQQLLLP